MTAPPARALAALLVLLTMAAIAPAAAADEAAWEALKRPGAVALMRHARAPGTGDPPNFTLGDCTTQRNLDERGRAQARRIGEAFRQRGIAVDRVLTSAWCRCRETAELLDLAPVERLTALNSFFRNREQREPRTQATRAFLAAAPDDERLVLVTHFVNISALTGRTTRSGEMVVVEVAEDGTVTVLGEILAARP
jgi:phosphohistidine phosphatase SixA